MMPTNLKLSQISVLADFPDTQEQTKATITRGLFQLEYYRDYASKLPTLTDQYSCKFPLETTDNDNFRVTPSTQTLCR